jgi:hypothetical protein
MSTPFEIFRVPLTIFRQNPGTYVNGEWVKPDPAEIPIPITASIQPTTGEDVLSIPEGRRNSKSYALFTSTEIETIHASNTANPDQIEIYGERFEIIKVEIWQNNPAVFWITNHFKMIAIKLEAIIPEVTHND